jgi:hypothetical protein
MLKSIIASVVKDCQRTPNLQDEVTPLVDYSQLLIQYISTYSLYLMGISSSRNVRTRCAVIIIMMRKINMAHFRIHAEIQIYIYTSMHADVHRYT